MSTDTAMKVISMVEACAVWAALFVAVFFITKASGMKNSLPKEVKTRLDSFAKLLDSFCKMLSDEKHDSDKQITKAFGKINHSHRKIEKIFAVYVYEHPLSTSAQSAYDCIFSIREKLQQMSRGIAQGESQAIVDVFAGILKQIEASKEYLDVVIKDEEGDKYYKA